MAIPRDARGFKAEYFRINWYVDRLDQIDFRNIRDSDRLYTEIVSEINQPKTYRAFYWDGEHRSGAKDDFAIRYSGIINVKDPGEYTFFLGSDDGARLLIDDQAVINNDGVHPFSEKNGKKYLTAGQHKVEVWYFDSGGEAGVDLDWEGPGFAREQMTTDDRVPGTVNAEYFNIPSWRRFLDQIDFNAEPVYEENVKEINENTSGAFYDGGRKNDFAARYTGTFEAPADGQYTFYLTSDDGSRLYINGEMVINNDYAHPSRTYSKTIKLGAGTHDIELRYFEQAGGAIVDLDWKGPGFWRRQMTFEQDTGGFDAEYYRIKRGTDSLDDIDFKAAVPIYRESLDKIEESSWGDYYENGPSSYFAVRYTGKFEVSEADAYIFHLWSDDGARLFIDGVKVIDNDGSHQPREQSARIGLAKGEHTVELRYFEGGGYGEVELNWSGPGFDRRRMVLEEREDEPGDGAGVLFAHHYGYSWYKRSLDHIDFDRDPDYAERLTEINESSEGAFYEGGKSDNFAVRYFGNFEVSKFGDYRFYLTSDDGARLYIDDQLVVNHDGHHRATLRDGSIELTPGTHTIELRYFEGRGGAHVDLDWSGPDFGRKQMMFEDGPSDGFKAEHFKTPSNLQKMGDFDFSGDPFHTERVDKIDEKHTFEGFVDGADWDDFAVRYTGKFEVPEGGKYTFYMTSDDGSLLLINGQVVLSNDFQHPTRTEERTIDLASGIHTIELQYFEAKGFAEVELEWSGPGFDRTHMMPGKDLPLEGIVVHDDPNTTQYETGTPGFDRYVIDDRYDSFRERSYIKKTPDGEGVEVARYNSLGQVDFLYDFEEIEFNDQTITIDDIVG